MPLHLLGKKSWNVYNTSNIEKVRADETAATLRSEERDRVRQEQDAAHRTALLRGEPAPTFAPLSPSDDESSRRPKKRDHDVEGGEMGREERKRRRKGRDEDDTSYAIRMAALDREVGAAATSRAAKREAGGREVEIVDHAGHIQLFAPPDEREIRKTQKNEELEREKKRKERELEDQYTMRFSNAGGFNKNVASAPWYAANGGAGAGTSGASEAAGVIQEDVEGKNVWGRPDPARKERDKARVCSNDPFAFMQKAQGQLKQAEKDRGKWVAEKEKEARELERVQKEATRLEKEERRRRRYLSEKDSRSDRNTSTGRRRDARERDRRDSVDSLEGFSLDAPKAQHKEHRHRERSEKRHRSRSCERRERSRHRSRSRERSERSHHLSRHRHKDGHRSRLSPHSVKA